MLCIASLRAAAGADGAHIPEGPQPRTREATQGGPAQELCVLFDSAGRVKGARSVERIGKSWRVVGKI